MIFSLFHKETAQEKAADALYREIVAQARQPEFYIDYQVEDSVTGRFEMIVLHAYMLFHRLRDEDQQARDLGQAVFDRFFKDMDHSLREIGIGDLSVPKKIKKMAQAFYGHVGAYDTSREEGDESFAAALTRNIYPDTDGIHDKAPALVDYVQACTQALAEQSVENFAKGQIHFPAIIAVSKTGAV
ncbi:MULTISPECIES: ubiquinol-cytochrome C chaperone family protein [Cohaesibacter]|uniref:ubiquinol-cytochrome C chaperone family protein n=1 Tax=Cohaesibacter TaxID=655352 RepID=UPI000DE84643|nr:MULTISPECIES: ubiquinol-cytochrome C chaperone family protein [Cohaesibacter]TLP43414.1 ubiquinol-cytochrome C chaperone [Cohaesibacter sp. CAU 1516]